MQQFSSAFLSTINLFLLNLRTNKKAEHINGTIYRQRKMLQHPL